MSGCFLVLSGDGSTSCRVGGKLDIGRMHLGGFPLRLRAEYLMMNSPISIARTETYIKAEQKGGST